MSVLRKTRTAYGLTSALPKLSPETIVAKRAPTSSDKSEIGTLWVNKLTGGCYRIVNISEGSASWLTQEANFYAGVGAPTFAAAKGSLYSRTDGSSTSTRMYVCSVATGTWVSITTSA